MGVKARLIFLPGAAGEVARRRFRTSCDSALSATEGSWAATILWLMTPPSASDAATSPRSAQGGIRNQDLALQARVILRGVIVGNGGVGFGIGRGHDLSARCFSISGMSALSVIQPRMRVPA